MRDSENNLEEVQGKHPVPDLEASVSRLTVQGHIRTLFWPSLRSAADLDYVAAQGYWVCLLVGTIYLALAVVLHYGFFWGAVDMLFYYVGGVGIRNRSRYAAIVVLLDATELLLGAYATDGALSVTGIVILLAFALLFSSLRVTWVAQQWKTRFAGPAVPIATATTLIDNFTNQWPRRLWPRLRFFFYIYSVLHLFLAPLTHIGAGEWPRITNG